jgi:hypothetical protein
LSWGPWPNEGELSITTYPQTAGNVLPIHHSAWLAFAPIDFLLTSEDHWRSTSDMIIRWKPRGASGPSCFFASTEYGRILSALLYVTVSISHYIASNGRMIHE